MQVDLTQIRSAEMNLNMLAISHNLGWPDGHIKEVPLPERVSVQQFLNFDALSSHAITVDRIGASVPSLWGSLLSTNTPFDLIEHQATKPILRHFYSKESIILYTPLIFYAHTQ
jgi:hypothetical protein